MEEFNHGKMDGKTMDIIAENMGKLKALFPETCTEYNLEYGKAQHF